VLPSADSCLFATPYRREKSGSSGSRRRSSGRPQVVIVLWIFRTMVEAVRAEWGSHKGKLLFFIAVVYLDVLASFVQYGLVEGWTWAAWTPSTFFSSLAQFNDTYVVLLCRVRGGGRD